MRGSVIEKTTMLAELIASRLCHDLINPMGAIGNGIELLELGGRLDGPEMDLIRDSIRSAEGKIQLFRLAFGEAGPGAMTSSADASGALSAYFLQSRMAANWSVEGDCSRSDVKAAFLAVLCLETAMPLGGTIQIERNADDALTLSASGLRIVTNETLWNFVTSGRNPPSLSASEVQFLALAVHLNTTARTLAMTSTDSSLALAISAASS